MPEIEDEAIIEIGADECRFNTQTNGDMLVLQNFNVTKEQAGTIAYLVNSKCDLEIQIKCKPVE